MSGHQKVADPVPAGHLDIHEQLQVVRKRWPDPTYDELSDALVRVGDGGRLERVLAFGDRPTSSAALVQTSLGRRFIKRYHTDVRVPAQLQAEHAFVAHLRSRGFATPAHLTAEDGSTAFSVGAWTYEVTAGATGEDRYRGCHTWSAPRPADAFGAGAALARLHGAAAGFDLAPRAPRDAQVSAFELFRPSSDGDSDFAVRWARWIDQRPVLAGYLRKRNVDPPVDFAAHLRFERSLAEVLDAQPGLWTHNDLHVSNLFFDGAAVTDTIDFGLANRTVPLYDLATTIERNAIPWLEITAGQAATINFDVAANIVDGYDSVSPLTRRQRAALVALLPIVQAEFALSAIEHQAGDERADIADWSYDIFFLEHTRWFETAAGAAALAGLRLALGLS